MKRWCLFFMLLLNAMITFTMELEESFSVGFLDDDFASGLSGNQQKLVLDLLGVECIGILNGLESKDFAGEDSEDDERGMVVVLKEIIQNYKKENNSEAFHVEGSGLMDEAAQQCWQQEEKLAEEEKIRRLNKLKEELLWRQQQERQQLAEQHWHQEAVRLGLELAQYYEKQEN